MDLLRELAASERRERLSAANAGNMMNSIESRMLDRPDAAEGYIAHAYDAMRMPERESASAAPFPTLA
jgi:hypothetical protein